MTRLQNASWFLPLVLSVAILQGCKEHAQTNFSHIRYEIDPIIQSQRDPTVNMGSYRTFTVFLNPNSPDPLLEKQLLFIASNMLEALGYSYAEDPEQPDMVLAMFFDNQYHSNYVPPSTVTIPRYVPGQTSPVSGQWSAWAGGTYSWGTTYGTVTTPGYWTTQTYTKPGYTTGAFYPLVGVYLCDPRRYREDAPQEMLVWSGIAVGCSKLPDLKMTGQLLMLRMFAQNLPPNPHAKRPSAAMGLAIAMLTPDGKDIYPTIVQVAKGSPAEKAGLRAWDILLRIGNRATTNMRYADVTELLSGNPGDVKNLRILRLKETIEVDIPLVECGEIDFQQ